MHCRVSQETLKSLLREKLERNNKTLFRLRDEDEDDEDEDDEDDEDEDDEDEDDDDEDEDDEDDDESLKRLLRCS